ncbi:OsmC family protein [Metabacillus arenae]|uniref:OsmC family protein n=1 Tax=Metabacillus arenae TaxID=2771434 RepID=A0A926NE33_9BACI|nr:OsmC family protein [Metabacillus arenae]MBD1381794.1 OsmC family protein [Metabacillus arenae]
MKIELRRISTLQHLVKAQTRSLVMDVDTNLGGEDVGFRPFEVWLTSLSSCSAYTMTRYARENKMDLQDIQMTAEDTVDETGHISAVTFHVATKGDLTKEQKEELFTYVRNNCKLLRTVSSNIQVHYLDAQAEEGENCKVEGGNCCL